MLTVLAKSFQVVNSISRFAWSSLACVLSSTTLCIRTPLSTQALLTSCHNTTCKLKRSLSHRLFGTDVHISDIGEVAEYIREPREDGSRKRVVVMAGAGISTASGIPDFRSPGTGLYSNLQKFNLPYPEAVFDIEYFTFRPEPFFMLSQELYPSGKYRPNTAHHFVKLLHDQGLLLRMYTQNVDGLERLAGIPAEKLVEAHGTYYTAHCRRCHKSYQLADIVEHIKAGRVVKCHSPSCNGVVKPDIVFFGEQLPADFNRYIDDMPRADLLIIMGTSLEVHPFAGIADAVLPGIPRILFNMHVAGPFLDNPRRNDVTSLGDLEETLLEFCGLLGWRDELKDLTRKG